MRKKTDKTETIAMLKRLVPENTTVYGLLSDYKVRANSNVGSKHLHFFVIHEGRIENISAAVARLIDGRRLERGAVSTPLTLQEVVTEWMVPSLGYKVNYTSL